MGTNQSKTSPNLSPKSSKSESNASFSTSPQTPKNLAGSFQRPKDNFFIFLKNEEEEFPKSSSFFSENGLNQDIIQATGAEPDISLEVFHALYNTLWPQIESQSDVSFKDTWTRFLGGTIMKGSLCPPEKLITERPKSIKVILSKPEGEKQIFGELDHVVSSIFDLKRKVIDYPNQLIHEEDIIASLNLLEEFYLRFRNQVKELVQAILEKEKANASSVLEYDALEDLIEPKAVMMTDIFSHHWAYRISRNKARKLLSLDENRRPIKNYEYGPSSHRISALPLKEEAHEALVHFKANGNPSIQLEKEFMLQSLYRNLQIPVPETALLILTDVFQEDPDYFYAVQASEAVIGESPLEAYRNSETVFDHKAYVSQVIGALLTNPSDGSFKNFKYSPKYKTFVSIDNDLVFKPEFARENVVNVKSMLYLLPQMDQTISDSIKTYFMTLDPQLTILAWLQALSQKNKEYQLLFSRLTFQKIRHLYQSLLPESEIPSLAACLKQKVNVDSHLQNGEVFYPQIFVSQNLLTSLTEKLQKIEKIFLQNPSVTLQILFEEVSPMLGKYYHRLRSQFHDPEIALEALWGEKKIGVDYSSISSVLSPEEFSSLSDNMMDQQNHDESIPEDFFKEYKDQLILGRSPLDNLVRRHNHRRKKGVLNLQEALKELRFLTQEGLTDSQSVRDIVDFCDILSKIAENDQNIIEEIISLIFQIQS